MKGSATVHWNGKFCTNWSSTEPAIFNFFTILYIILVHGTIDLGYFLENFWQHF